MIKRDKKGRYAKGNVSGRWFTSEMSKGNQYAKGCPPNKTSYKNGETAMQKNKNWRGGVQIMKKDVIHLQIAPNVRVRRPTYVYEQVYGKLPKGYVIYHKDGDMHNDDIDNLEAITRGEMMLKNNKII